MQEHVRSLAPVLHRRSLPVLCWPSGHLGVSTAQDWHIAREARPLRPLVKQSEMQHPQTSMLPYNLGRHSNFVRLTRWGHPHLFLPELEAEPVQILFDYGPDTHFLLLRMRFRFPKPPARGQVCPQPPFATPFFFLYFTAVSQPWLRYYQLPQTCHFVLLTPSQEKQYLCH